MNDMCGNESNIEINTVLNLGTEDSGSVIDVNGLESCEVGMDEWIGMNGQCEPCTNNLPNGGLGYGFGSFGAYGGVSNTELFERNMKISKLKESLESKLLEIRFVPKEFYKKAFSDLGKLVEYFQCMNNLTTNDYRKMDVYRMIGMVNLDTGEVDFTTFAARFREYAENCIRKVPKEFKEAIKSAFEDIKELAVLDELIPVNYRLDVSENRTSMFESPLLKFYDKSSGEVRLLVSVDDLAVDSKDGDKCFLCTKRSLSRIIGTFAEEIKEIVYYEKDDQFCVDEDCSTVWTDTNLEYELKDGILKIFGATYPVYENFNIETLKFQTGDVELELVDMHNLYDVKMTLGLKEPAVCTSAMAEMFKVVDRATEAALNEKIKYGEDPLKTNYCGKIAILCTNLEPKFVLARNVYEINNVLYNNVHDLKKVFSEEELDLMNLDKSLGEEYPSDMQSAYGNITEYKEFKIEDGVVSLEFKVKNINMKKLEESMRILGKNHKDSEQDISIKKLV